MFRFTMPDTSLSLSSLEENICLQLDRYTSSDALRDLLKLIHADQNSIRDIYDRRTGRNGRILETQELSASDALEPVRHELYPLLKELGFFDINKAASPDFNRILVLGGSLNACRLRTKYAASVRSEHTLSVDALTCYRPINPVERRASDFTASADTEFGVLSESFADIFGLGSYDDEYTGDRNLNSISCIRRFNRSAEGCGYNLYAAPSSAPEQRRADTGDTFRFYLDSSDVSSDDSLLFLTNNSYCNRQFIQLAYQLVSAHRSVHFDIIGTNPERNTANPDTYGPFHYIQELIATLDWIERFKSLIESRQNPSQDRPK